MGLMEKLQPVFILAAVIGGLLLGQWDGIAQVSGGLILPFLVLMLVGVFLHVPLRQLGAAFANKKFMSFSIGVNFLWTPFFAWLLGMIFLADSPQLWVGLIMLLVTPCTDWYLIFTGISRGNVALGTAILPWNLLLQLLLLPLYLLLLAGAVIAIDLGWIIHSVVLVLAIPLVVATLIRVSIARKWGEDFLQEKMLPTVEVAQVFFLNMAILAMFASQGRILVERPDVVWQLLIPLGIFFGGNFLLGQLIGKLAKFSYGELSAFTFTTLARNSPLALAIAVVAFPNEPLIPLVLAIGPLIELPILALAAQGLLLFNQPSGQ